MGTVLKFIGFLKPKGFPSPTGVNHYEYKLRLETYKNLHKFPSPTGVNHYEYYKRVK